MAGPSRDGPAVRAHLLGPTRLEVPAGTCREWPRPTARRLVVLLLLAPLHHRRRGELVEHLFDHLEPSAGRRALSKALSLARSVVDEPDGPSLLVADREGVRFREGLGIRVDLVEHTTELRAALGRPGGAARVRALRGALATTGEPLADDADEPWAADPRREVAALRARARRAVALEVQSLDAWEVVFSHSPVDEDAAARLVELHLAAGRVDAARRVHARCVRALDEELGGTPSERLDAAIAGAVSRPVVAITHPPDMLGRDAELDEVLRLAAADRPSAVVVSGEAGMGKTLLLGHAHARLVDGGWRVAAAVSAPDDGRLPYVALRSVLSQLRTLAPLPPLVRRVLAGTAGAGSVGPASDAELAAQLAQFLAEVAASRPVAVVLDDLQWADVATRRLVLRLSAATRAGEWVVLAGWRTADPAGPELVLPSTIRSIELTELDAAVVRQIVVASADVPEASVDELVDRASGNPFFAVELARATAMAGVSVGTVLPDRLVDTLRHRVAACTGTTRRLVAVVALAGEDATYGRLARTMDGLGDEDGVPDLDDATEEAWRAHLLRPTTDGLRASHPLLRDVVQETLSPTRQSRLHTALACAIADEPGHAARLSEARHRLAAYEATHMAELAPAAVRAALVAGHAARSANGWEVAVDLFRTAAQIHARLPREVGEPLDDELARGQVALGRVAVEVGRAEMAETALRQALDLTRQPPERAEAWCQLANVPYREGDFPGAIRLHDLGLADVGRDELARARLLGERGWALVRLGRMIEGTALLREASDVLESSGDWAAAGRALDRLGASLVMASVTPDDHREALGVLDRALALCRRSRLPVEAAIVDMHRARVLEAVGRATEADEALAHAFRVTREAAATYEEAVAHWIAADLADGRGEPEAALARRTTESELLERCGNDNNLVGCQLHRARLLRRLGREVEARAAEAAAHAAAHRAGHPRLLRLVHEPGRRAGSTTRTHSR